MLKRERFESITKLEMPELFDTKNVLVIEILDDLEKYTYVLREPLHIEQIKDLLMGQKGLMLLYDFTPSKATLCGRTCCIVSKPTTDNMVRISATTDDKGVTDEIHLTVYSSLDVMCGEIMNEERRMAKQFNYGFEDSYCEFLLSVF